MPTVLITGVTGFLAAHTAVRFLEGGWNVRGTLRSKSKIQALNEMPEFRPYIEKGMLEFYITGPLESGDYSEAIKGVDAVAHVASPVEFEGSDFRKDYMIPAVNGTKGVLEAAAEENSVKAVVMTSTYGAVGDHRKHPTAQAGKLVNEENWNPCTIEELEKMSSENSEGNGAFLAGYLYYMGAKKYAELAAWEIQKKAKWSLATMCCTMIWGPPIQPLSSLSKGGMSTEFMYMILGGKEAPIMDTLFPYYVDVRDAAEAHYQAIMKQSQGRFILAASPFSYQQIADDVREWYPEESHRIPIGHPGEYEFEEPGVYKLSNEKSKTELGLEYRPWEETIKDTFDRLLVLEKQGLN
ncbi:hypothetical protein TREMEDRAFT_24957 [Tremella mesenterica DSM 1558]|uniref:uncharacterized protein n=1 Tax=Tremella mesenterica (strain ATCC 24925 / CBS 8224 / DSM 1558 / NBRC 9311 / NRRL Y-6157 / RJB 2259-6 / UBC 559-6) TaxID=578456 RepID=UPI0003F4941A|nr:uncharacterized protein TREMEDRAFT_24957 [Tremella mesenterica DSM 1558]EIW73384.1 hypothetical protein TREMEDRAFT_24957 [Tremella mesenterica DSM 1558]